MSGHQLTKANLIDQAISRIDETNRFRRRRDVLDGTAF
jgi:hypothetical protein